MAYKYRPKKRPRAKKSYNIVGLIVSFFLGLIIGVGGFAGGLVGAGSLLYSKPVSETVDLLDKYIPSDLYGTLFGTEDKEGILNEKYASMKIGSLFSDSYKAISELSNDGSLATLNEVSPKIGAFVEDLLEKTDKYSIPLEKETLMSTALKELPKYFTNSLKETPIGGLLDSIGKGDDPLLMAISYGEEGVDYMLDTDGKVVMLGDAKKTTINDLLSGGFDSLLFKLTFDSVMTIDPTDTVMCAIAYGSSNRYTVVDGKVQMTQVAYTLEDKGDGVKLYDDRDAAVPATMEILGADICKLTFDDGQVQYVSFDGTGIGVAFSDETLTSPVLYKKTKIGDLTEDSMSIINNIYLKDALKVDATQHKVLISLAYGEENVDFKYVGEGANKTIEMIGTAKPRTIGELRQRGGNLINEIPLSDIMAVNTDEPLVMYLLYGKENIHYSVDGSGNVTMLQKQIALIGDVVYNEYGEKLSGYTLDTANTLYTDSQGNAFKYVPSALTVETNDGTADVYYLTDLSGNAVYFAKTTLGDMAGNSNLITSLTKRITLKDVIDEETMNSNLFFKHVQDETIETLPNAINNLTLQQVYANEIFKQDANGNFVDKNGNITTNKDEYVVKGIWWYLLHDENNCKANHGVGCDRKCVEDYNVTQLSKLVPNMQENVHLSTLNDLSDNGLVQFSGSTLDSPIKTQVTVPVLGTYYVKVKDSNGNTVNASVAFAGKASLGELTVEEILQYVDGVINLFAQIEG